MAQRNSEYARIANDLYVTPRWVWDAIASVEKFHQPWDCAPVNPAFDFLERSSPSNGDIVTNPPFRLAEQFVRHALAVTKHRGGKVAMLLPYSFDSAKSRVDLFKPPFKIRYNLTKRIRWENLEQKKAGPSQNHAWYVWDWSYSGPPMVGWLHLQVAA
jgi:hypothetical protein